jgi:hypothetical protein
MDGAGVADGDQLADPGMPGDRRGQVADGGVVFGLADQPGQLSLDGRRPGSGPSSGPSGGASYRAVLRRELIRLLGIERTAADRDRNREGPGMPKELIRALSKRTEQVRRRWSGCDAQGR